MSKISAYSKAFFNHENYHGWFKNRKFFEGWYFKLVDKTEQHAFAIIPGIAMDANKNKQSFIQILDGKKITSAYHKFSAEAFIASQTDFVIQVNGNVFSNAYLKINLPELQGELYFENHFLWPKKIFAPGIMGWYAFVPFMQCYHQVVSMNFTLKGKLISNNTEIDFDNGKGYIEKDWGRSFPSSWIWMQSNHFAEEKISFKLSVAKIPWLASSFVGFICAFLLKDRFIKFATYTGARLKNITLHTDYIYVELADKHYILKVKAYNAEGAMLASPVMGFMDGRVSESMNARIEIQLIDKKTGATIFNDTGHNAALEIAGKTEELLKF